MEKIQIALVIGVLLVTGSSVWASNHNSAQLQRLLNPQAYHISMEENGSVYIYDGLYDSDVELALDQQFHRVDHMMFVRTRVVENGEVFETDDCD